MFNQETILMPYLMDALRVAQAGRVRGSHLLLGLVLAFFVTLVCCNYTVLKLAYARGGLALREGYFTSGPTWPFNRLANNLNNPIRTNWPHLFFVGVGGAFMAFMILMQRRFLWWPVHPLGFVMASTGTAATIWFSFFLGWFIKWAVQRYGGYSAYRRLVPVFIGLVLGELVIAGAWSVLDAALRVTGHDIYPAV